LAPEQHQLPGLSNRRLPVQRGQGAPCSPTRFRHLLALTDEDARALFDRRRTAWLAARLQRLSPDQLAAIDDVIEPLALLLSAGEPA